MPVSRFTLSVLAIALLGCTAAQAQTTRQAAVTPPTPPEPAAGAPAPLVILFDRGSSTLRPQDKAVLDHASRSYNEGKPIVMILTGTADRVGAAQVNLTLSQRRALAVLKGLLDRGIPADRFQILAKGETELPVPTGQGVPEARNRSVEISWH